MIKLKNLAPCFFSALIFSIICVVPVVAESKKSTRSDAASRIVASAFALTDQDAVRAALLSGASKQTLVSDKKYLFSLLAEYEERLGLNDSASTHFSEAAFADPANRDDTLLLDAARCSLASNDISRADGFIRAVMLTCFDEKLLVRARVYAAWLQLSSADRAAALALLRSYSKNPVFDEYAPALLFTLFWAESDTDARSRLLASYPGTPEAAIVRGEMLLSPAPFWYLMGKNESLVAAFAHAGTGAVSATPAQSSGTSQSGTASSSTISDASASSSSPILPSPAATAPVSSGASGAENAYQQVGFFRVREYADDLVAQLKAKGFSPIIRTEKRPSGTVYFVVVVAEDQNRSVGMRLKDAGFESFLVFDAGK